MIGITIFTMSKYLLGSATKPLANPLEKINMKVTFDLYKVICAWNDLYGMAGANF